MTNCFFFIPWFQTSKSTLEVNKSLLNEIEFFLTARTKSAFKILNKSQGLLPSLQKVFYDPLSRGMLAFKMVFTTTKSGHRAVLLLTIRCRWWEMGSEWVSYNPLSLVLPQEVRDGNAGLATRGQSHTRVESWRFIISNDGVKWVWVRWLSYPKKILSMRWNQSPRNIFSHSLFFNFLSYFRQNIRRRNFNSE